MESQLLGDLRHLLVLRVLFENPLVQLGDFRLSLGELLAQTHDLRVLVLFEQERSHDLFDPLDGIR